MLFRPSEIVVAQPSPEPTPKQEISGVRSVDTAELDNDYVVDVISSPKMLGEIEIGKAKHYYSSGAFNLVQLVLYCLKQTGPAHVFLCTYSVSDRAITTLRNHLDGGGYSLDALSY